MIAVLLACLAEPAVPVSPGGPVPITGVASPAGPAPASPLARIDLSPIPHKLHQIAFLEGAWGRPPDPGTLPGFELVDDPATLVRRTGAGESRWPVSAVVPESGGWNLTVVREGAQVVVALLPWSSSGVPTPPAPAWALQVGSEAPSGLVAWVPVP